jgi:signal transduction histidine kinase
MDGGQQLLASLEDDIRGEVAALRRVMVELRPPALDEWGLSAALSDYAKTFEEQTGIACTVQADLPGRLARAQETVLYRVAQEALTNVVKHARADHAWVTLRIGHGQVTLEIGDDGTGFVTAQAADPIAGHLGLNHFGLASMRQQLEMAGGSWQVYSRPGSGTTVTASLPLTA